MLSSILGLSPYIHAKSMTTYDKAFKKIEDSAQFLSKTINDFRNFYRPDNEKTLFNICDSMESVLGMLNLESQNIEINFNCSQYDDGYVYTFDGELKQVFLSIINNAVDSFTSPSELLDESKKKMDKFSSPDSLKGFLPGVNINNPFKDLMKGSKKDSTGNTLDSTRIKDEIKEPEKKDKKNK